MTIKKAKQNNIEYVIKIINQNKKYQYINKINTKNNYKIIKFSKEKYIINKKEKNKKLKNK
jgi:hypothetical protein